MNERAAVLMCVCIGSAWEGVGGGIRGLKRERGGKGGVGGGVL